MSYVAPHTFTDSQFRIWPVAVNLGHVSQIQQVYPDFNLARIVLADSPEHVRLGEDTSLLCHVLEVVLAKPLQLRGVTFPQLLDAMQGSEAHEAVLALLRAVADFSPSRAMKQSARLIEQQLRDLQQIDQECGAKLEAAISSGISSGSVPPGPESVHSVTPCGNSVASPMPPPGGAELPTAWTPEPFPLSPDQAPRAASPT